MRNKPNLPGFWAKNEGGQKKKANRRAQGPPLGIGDWRDERRDAIHEMRVHRVDAAPNKPNHPICWGFDHGEHYISVAGSGERTTKPIGRLRAKPANPKSEARNPKQTQNPNAPNVQRQKCGQNAKQTQFAEGRIGFK
jgi:hypothetical protein